MSSANGVSQSSAGCRQNFPVECENLLNLQINAELSASYAYFSMWAWCKRDEIALPGLSAFYKASYEEELEHAHKFSEYLLERGGKITFQPVKPHSQSSDWSSALQTLEQSLNLEKHVNELLLKLAARADELGDQHLAEMIQGEFLEEQIEGMKRLADMITQLKRVGGGSGGDGGLGLYLFDQNLLKSEK